MMQPTQIIRPHANRSLDEVPDSRPDVIARGKALIADPNYPSREQVRKIAALLATKWSGQSAVDRNITPSLRSSSERGVIERSSITALSV